MSVRGEEGFLNIAVGAGGGPGPRATIHRHGLEVEVEGLLKDLVVIFGFLGMLCTVRCFF
jgi:hypothetical protein